MATAIVEIGTRAVRLLVATKHDDGLRVLDSSVQDNPLNSQLSGGLHGAMPADALDVLARVLRHMLDTMTKRHEVTDRIVYGTESLRRLDPGEIAQLTQRIPELRVLTQGEEARACHASACLVARMAGRQGGELISGDIGSGSFELCAGELTAPGVLNWSLGTALGSNRLRELYLEGGLAMVRRLIDEALKARGDRRQEHPRTLVFSGSAPTKFAWLQYKHTVGAERAPRYDMKKIQGATVSQADLAKYSTALDELRANDRDAATQVVSPEKPGGPELEILLGGMQVMSCTLSHVGCSELIVSGYGSRHGIAWLMLQEGHSF